MAGLVALPLPSDTPAMPAGMVTFLLTNVEGYTALW
jgi:hypothetical protein